MSDVRKTWVNGSPEWRLGNATAYWYLDSFWLFYCGGKGGQKQNKTETGVRLTDRITGLVAEGREHRTQPQNQKAAFTRLVDKMIAYYEAEKAQTVERIMGGDTVRTYHEKRSEVKCHLTGEKYDYQQVLDGKLDPLIRGLLELDAIEEKTS